ncbi:ROK family protein [Lacrimispora algidixylanolytica]|uniref:Glucokinase n=1 Tax=Lacrimispora algidixylanolytica TaxID=94868 RepID=A0A419TC64_9FIRM|nr:ROK family protein [Lacrimispora algidixylanolytica]RKD35068.1 glucokinase [Lacrimispora algidixylanolytica]
MRYYVGIDLGGTNIAAGLVGEDGTLIKQMSVPTKSGRSAREIVKDMASLAKKVAEMGEIPWENIEAVGVGVPGTANRDTGMVEYANNLGFYDEPMVSMLKEELPGKSIRFDNDANAAAWGEYVAGSGKGSKSMLAVTLGTGVGGGIILDGKLFRGVNYAAGEFGHFVIDRNGIPCNCGRRGCFETYASATALVAQTKEAMEQHPESLLWELCGKNIDLVEGRTLFDGVRQGDEIAKQVLSQFIEYLATGLVDLINIFQPEVLCIGGGISKAGDLLLKPLQAIIDKEDYAATSRNRTKITVATLDNDAGLIGAALLES